ncbi:hypothetical protein [Acuticoccus sp.]|uniref:hypothetical protein n=1 Tax=Acuticoccus sp. TaxID=1904378 RepID=UPI003B5217C2
MIPALIAAMLLSSLALLVQARTGADAVTVGRLIETNREAFARWSAHELARVEAARALIRRGSRMPPFELDVPRSGATGLRWMVLVQRVAKTDGGRDAVEITFRPVGE